MSLTPFLQVSCKNSRLYASLNELERSVESGGFTGMPCGSSDSDIPASQLMRLPGSEFRLRASTELALAHASGIIKSARDMDM